MKIFFTLVIATTFNFLIGCGGGGDDDNPTTPINNDVSYTVNTTTEVGGSISPTTTTVNNGGTTTFTITVDSNYEINDVTGCSGSLSGNTYTTGAITADCTVSALFNDNPPPIDNTPPILSAGSPSGTLPSGTTNTTLSLSTDEDSTCRYTTVQNTNYSAIANTFSTTGGVSHSQVLTELLDGTSYAYYVRCSDTSANSTDSDYLISFSVDIGADIEVPTTPTNLSASALSPSQISLSWTASSDNVGVTGYRIYRDGTQINTAANTSFTDTELTAETAYFYTVSAYDVAGNNSDQSNSASATTLAVVTTSTEPKLNFTDIVSGPSTGLGDELGNGTIVTIWGNNLGSSQSGAEIKFRAFDGTVSDIAYVYYWKNADGELPSGPANLYKSHRMQEIAISIPESVMGTGTLFVVVGGVQSNSLEFTVRTGAIKWVAPEGNNNNECTFASPCEWINGDIGAFQSKALGNARLNQGDIVYSRGVLEPDTCGGGVCAGLFLRSIVGTATDPISLIAYPGTQPKIISANRGVNPYLSDYINISKYHISVGSKDPLTPPDPGNSSASDVHIQATKGRYVGNYMDEKIGTCFNGWSGSITSGGNGGSNAKLFGNHFYALGCDNASRFQHTLYMSVRNENATNVQAWEIGWNYLEDNESFFGIHNYDETYSGDCGNLVGELSIHDNFIINQKGAGINIGTKDLFGDRNICWEADIAIYNNVLINTGLGPAADDNVVNAGAIRIGGDLGSSYVNIFNNTIYGFSDESSRLYDNPKAITIGFSLADPVITINNNYIHSFGDYDFITTSEPNVVENNNIYYSTVTGGIDPQCTLSGAYVDCSNSSPLINGGLTLPQTSYDIYGIYRGESSEIGAIEY